jgi:hypothetical protein
LAIHLVKSVTGDAQSGEDLFAGFLAAAALFALVPDPGGSAQQAGQD